MGNDSSSTHLQDVDNRFDGVDTVGYRVLGVQPKSPASSAGLVSFFDFLVGANDQMLFGAGVEEVDGNDNDRTNGEYYNDLDFRALLRDNVDKKVELLIWNIKSQNQRTVQLIPSLSWGGTGLLGVTIRMDDYAAADERLLRILSVSVKSPAAISGLVPMTDYLLGTSASSFDNGDALADILTENEDKTLGMYVYNVNTDEVRIVTITPTTSWGGMGLLGAEIGRGYLHRLPQRCRDTLGISLERKIPNSTCPMNSADGVGRILKKDETKAVKKSTRRTVALGGSDAARPHHVTMSDSNIIGRQKKDEEFSNERDIDKLTWTYSQEAEPLEAVTKKEKALANEKRKSQVLHSSLDGLAAKSNDDRDVIHSLASSDAQSDLSPTKDGTLLSQSAVAARNSISSSVPGIQNEDVLWRCDSSHFEKSSLTLPPLVSLTSVMGEECIKKSTTS